MDLTQPFRGSLAVAAGLVTPAMLRGPRFRRLFPDVYVLASVPVTLALRSRAAHLLANGKGVLAGYSAAELLNASCGPADAPAELVLPHRMRSRPDLWVRQELLLPDEIQLVGDIAVTTPLRTAYDLGRRAPLVEAVAAMDALAHAAGFNPADVLMLLRRHLGARGSAQLPQVVELSDRRADSPMESRIRVALRLGGLPLPVLQHPVGPYELDLAYPAVRIAVEYNGRDHLEPDQALHDLRREAYLTREGWIVLRFGAYEVMYRPGRIAAQVRAQLVAAARRAGLPLEALSAA
jgi:very-short-patch-repair endonuclease